MPVTALDVREIALRLPRAYEAWVRDYRKFRVGRIVFATVSPDETELGFGFPREEREDLVAAEPEKFFLPRRAVDLRYQWVCAKLAALDLDELEELIIDAWTMCVPAFLAQEWFEEHPRGQASRDL
ncbi:MAG TPA: MmcQ/YjbR family DNA-binding protein [Marmoricola sp.]